MTPRAKGNLDAEYFRTYFKVMAVAVLVSFALLAAYDYAFPAPPQAEKENGDEHDG